ncbi:MAG: hypothetical protein KUG75_04655 [Pseudomonadales bacterium]|nr:hypothetical protein [Pseudomonadales bacterium]
MNCFHVQKGRLEAVTSRTLLFVRTCLKAFKAVGALMLFNTVSGYIASANELYQYINSQGQFEISDAIPAELVSNGYTVVNEHGQIVRIVEPELTPAQQREKAVQDKKLKEKHALESWEDELMLRYSSPRDVAYARDQKTNAIETSIASTKLNIDRLELKKQELQKRAANMERAGQALTPSLLHNLEIVNEQIEGRYEEVKTRRAEQEATRKEFSRIMKKIRELYDIPESDLDEPVKIDLSKINH